MNLHVTTRMNQHSHIIEVTGEVDLYSSPVMRESILNTIKKQTPHTLIVKLDEVSYIDSSGIATLVEGLQLANEYKTQFKLVGLSQHVLEVFQLARLERVFRIYLTEEDALKDGPTT